MKALCGWNSRKIHIGGKSSAEYTEVWAGMNDLRNQARSPVNEHVQFNIFSQLRSQ